MKKETKKPEKTFRLAGIEASIWKQKTADGKPFYSVTLTRSYTVKKGEWKRTNSFGRDELKVIIEKAQEALAHLERLSDA